MSGHIEYMNADNKNFTPVSVANPLPVTQGSRLPATGVQMVAASGNVAAATATATLTHDGTLLTYLSGFEATAGGATAAAVVSLTVTGLLGGTLTYTFGAPLGAGVPATPLVVEFDPPLQAASASTDVVVSMPSLGTGNTNASIVAHGFKA